ncbi:GTPase IMAP family member 8-like [Cololabis saira]|uniref:GTPase IMAP family member 8-like n=1 Tax=Cololabis saira TaxID=129043 RepID=UPI002AD5728E|nr:GTPase IMAP family member 8-like [Cololabis saira]
MSGRKTQGFMGAVDPNERRIVLVGKTGVGMSAAGNTILGREAFESKLSLSSLTSDCDKARGSVDGRPVAIIDTPGLFDTNLTQEEVQSRITSCISLSTPGPHAFLVVLQLGRLTQEEKETVKMIQTKFGEAAARYTMVLFTHGDKLKNQTIEGFISKTPDLVALVQSCSGRYHVFNNEVKDLTQTSELLDKIDRMTTANGGNYYSNDMFVRPEAAIEKEKERLLKEREEERQSYPAGFVGAANPNERRIVLVGKTGVGMSAAGNTILGREAFESVLSLSSLTSDCQKATGSVDGRPVAVIDTPGLFDTNLTQEEVQSRITSCISLSSPGPHAFLVVLQLGRLTQEEKETVKMIQTTFGEEAARYTMLLFTHGDKLKKQTIEGFLSESADLVALIQSCSNRYHVFNNKVKDLTQTSQLLDKIDRMTTANGGSYYSNDMFVRAEEEERLLKEREEERIVLVGKTGVGKSAAGNTIVGREAFESVLSPSSLKSDCQKAKGSVACRPVAIIDTPALFDTNFTQKEVQSRIKSCIYLSAPGPHAFLVVLQLGRLTQEEKDTVKMIQTTFGEEAAKYTMVLFTHGDRLKEQTIEDFISKSPDLVAFIQSCSNRYHVFNNEVKDLTQTSQLLDKIDKMMMANGGSYYSNNMFVRVEADIEKEMDRLLKERDEEMQRELEELRMKYSEEVYRRKEAELNRKYEEQARTRAERPNKFSLSLTIGLAKRYGTAIGSAVGAIGGPIGSVVGGAVGGAAGAVVGVITVQVSKRCSTQ